jgi:hypothetical protein
MKLKLLFDHHIHLNKIFNQFFQSSSEIISYRTQKELDSVNLDYSREKNKLKL